MTSQQTPCQDHQSGVSEETMAVVPNLPPQGWQLVPVEPTEEMLDAAFNATVSGELWEDGVRSGFAEAYRAMLSAAPAAPVSGEDAPGKFRKKPVVIAAWQFSRVSQTKPAWLLEAINAGRLWFQGGDQPYYTIDTLEGRMRADLGDWIIRGVKGELYPCKPDIFAATYEPAAPVVKNGGEWRTDMENAPRDRHLLLCCDKSYVVPAQYRDDIHGGCWCRWGTYQPLAGLPTAWMPLPTPPSGKEQGGTP